MSRWWAYGRLLGGAAILAFVLWRVGGDAFGRGLAAVDVPSLGLPVLLGAVTTVAAAGRWCLVARGLGAPIGLRPAVAAYYRSQFLNTVLPGGVLGDVQRGLVSGRAGGDVGRGLRAVGWERAAGQVVQLGVTVIALLVLPSALRPMTGTLLLVVAGVAGAFAVLVVVRPRGRSRIARATRAAGHDVRTGVLARPSWPGIVLASVVVVAGHTITFVLAARTAGVEAPIGHLVPLAVITLLAMGVPANIGGWGPREGVAAWAFAMSGLGAAAGVTTAVVYGVMVFAACLPGALVVLARPARPARPAPARSASPARERVAIGHG